MKTNDQLFFKRKILSSNFTIFFLTFIIFFLLNFAKNAYNQKVILIEDVPIILEWNLLKNVSAFHKIHECSKKCFYTSDKNFEYYADMLIVNFEDPDLHILPKSQNPERINVFMNQKPSLHLDKKVPKGFFNITATYRLDSDVVMFYDFLEPIKEPSEGWNQQEVKELIDVKTYPVLYFDHGTFSKQAAIVQELRKYLNVTRYKNSSKMLLNEDDDFKANNIRLHYFTLAFEDTDCIDYVTEKTYLLKKLVVPIILNRNILRGIHEKLNPYVIALSDFKSIKDLADYLNFLMSNKVEYLKYFEWTKIYKKATHKNLIDAVHCRLCEIAWNQKSGYHKVIPDIRQWWEKELCYD